MNSVLIVDFNDSFTYNIACELERLDVPCKVLHFQELSSFSSLQNYRRVIWGPGPGHPLEYQRVLPWIEKLHQDPRVLQMGVCLGHQLIGLYLGFKIMKRKRAFHGEARRIDLNHFWKNLLMFDQSLDVQFYSSLTLRPDSRMSEVEVLSFEEEIIALYYPRLLSFQFHPESVGTSRPEIFFKAFLEGLNV